MADRTSAYVFALIFRELALLPEGRDIAKRIWGHTMKYDFSQYQMECDEALISLGLARRGVDPDYPDEGETVFYADADGNLK
jgi:hypothetical protein